MDTFEVSDAPQDERTESVTHDGDGAPIGAPASSCSCHQLVKVPGLAGACIATDRSSVAPGGVSGRSCDTAAPSGSPSTWTRA